MLNIFMESGVAQCVLPYDGKPFKWRCILSNLPNYFVAGIFWYLTKEGDLKFLVILYTRGSSTAIKFPGGTYKPGDDGYLETLRREMKEELGGHVELFAGQEVHSFVLEPTEFGKSSHTKKFVLVFDWEGEDSLRKKNLVERVPGKVDEILGPPMWVAVGDLLDPTSKKRIFPGHRAALVAAVQALQIKYPDVAFATAHLEIK